MYGIPWSQMTEAEKQKVQDTQLSQAQREWESLHLTHETGDDKLLGEFRRIIGVLSDLGQDARVSQLPTLLQELCIAIKTQEFLHEQDFEYLRTHGSLLFKFCMQSFEQRLTNYNWWHATVVFYHHLSKVASPEHISVFFNLSLMVNLVKSVGDISLADLHSEAAFIRETNRLVLLTLANVVGSNPFLADETQQMDVATSLEMLPPIESAEPSSVHAVAQFICKYLKYVPYLDLKLDRVVYELIDRILRLDLSIHVDSVSEVLYQVEKACSHRPISNSNEWESNMILALIDIFPQLKNKLTSDHHTPSADRLFHGFTHAVSWARSDQVTVRTSELKVLLSHPDWEVIAGYLKAELQVKREDPRLHRMAAGVLKVWKPEYCHQEYLCDSVPIPQGVIYLAVEFRFPQQDGSVNADAVEWLRTYFTKASLDNLNTFMGYIDKLLKERSEHMKACSELEDDVGYRKHIAGIDCLTVLVREAAIYRDRKYNYLLAGDSLRKVRVFSSYSSKSASEQGFSQDLSSSNEYTPN